MIPAAAIAAPEQLCAGQSVAPGPDGRVLGHLPYLQTPQSDLVSAPAGFAYGMPCLIHRDAAPDLARLLKAADRVPGVAGHLRGLSCYRTIPHQRAVFCSQIGPGKACRDAAERAKAVGPPGFSEHATGYALDFVVRPAPGCPDVDPCIAATPAGLWLLANAPRYGFELSFPAGNAQGVTWEPWHWRWVGTSPYVQGADTARAIFSRARLGFPARPAVVDVLPALMIDPPPRNVSVLNQVPPSPAIKRRSRR